MSKKWLAIAALIAFGVALAVAIPVLLPPTPGVTYANFSRLEEGMPRGEVEDLLGRTNMVKEMQDWEFGVWTTETRVIVTVQFDKNQCMKLAKWNGWRDDRTSLEKLRDRLPLIARDAPQLSVFNVIY